MSAVTKDIIFAYLAGHATVLQKKQIEEWLGAAGNDEPYCRWLEEWEKLHPQFIPDVPSAYSSFEKYLELDNSARPAVETKQRMGRKAPNYRLMIAAAAFTAFVCISFAFRETLLYKTYRTGNAEIKTFELPDNSIVTLNANSVLKISRFFSWQHTRRSDVSGEALFDVKHTVDDRPFVVGMPGNFEIRVLGTEFNVYARGISHKIYLNRGSICLQSTDPSFKPLMIRPGEMATTDRGRKVTVAREQSYEQVSAWKEHVFVFDSTPLDRVARMLEEQFGSKVIISDTSLGNRVISGSCKWAREEDILATLSLMMKFNVYQNKDSIVLK